MNKIAVLEGLLFIVGDEGLNIDQIKDVLEVSENEARSLLKELQSEYEKENRGIKISFLADTFKLTTKKEHFAYYQKLVKETNNSLSQAALETLAIIAYNQPITRAEIDELRGISSVFLIRKLMAKDLIKVCGKSDLPGRPILYSVTDEFLDYMGLSSLSDLPEITEPEIEIDNEKDLYESKYTE